MPYIFLFRALFIFSARFLLYFIKQNHIIRPIIITPIAVIRQAASPLSNGIHPANDAAAKYIAKPIPRCMNEAMIGENFSEL